MSTFVEPESDDDDDYTAPQEFAAIRTRAAQRTANDVAAPGEATCALNMSTVMEEAKRLSESFPQATWIKQIIALLDPSLWPAEKGPVGWCGWDDAVKPPRLQTHAMYAKSIATLMTPNRKNRRMLRHARKDYGGKRHTRCYMPYFQVPKDPGEDRGIGDARELNKHLDNVGGMQLAKIVQMFEALRELAGGHIYVGDLKSWFNQISIPEGIKPLFSVALGAEDFEYNTLVMGGQPSAKLAHGIACLWQISAGLRIGLKLVDAGGSAPPPVLRFMQDDVHVASVIPWIDNWCLIAKDPFMRNAFKKSLEHFTESSAWGIMIKQGSEFTQPLAQPFDFLGIRWKVTDGVVSWRHITANILDWAQLPRLQGNIVCRARTAARIVGVCGWHFSVRRGASGETLTLGRFAEVYETSAAIGDGRKCQSDWNKDWKPSSKEAEYINAHMDVILRHLPRDYSKLSAVELDATLDGAGWEGSCAPPPRPANSVHSASDASKTRGGHVIFTREEITHWEAVEFDRLAYACNSDTHINKLETATAIFSINAVLDRLGDTPTEIRHAIDNSTARSALRLGRYPKDQQLTQLLVALHKRIRRANCQLTVLQVPTGDMVADGPSRNDKVTKRPIAPTVADAARCYDSMKRADTRKQ